MTSDNPFEIARRQVDIAGKYLDLDPGILEMLKTTKREIQVIFRLRWTTGP